MKSAKQVAAQPKRPPASERSLSARKVEKGPPSRNEGEIQKLVLALQSGPVLSRSQRDRLCRYLSMLSGGKKTALKGRGKGRPRAALKFHPIQVRALALAVEYRMRLTKEVWGGGKNAARTAKRWAEKQFPGIVLAESEIANGARLYPKGVEPRSREFFETMVLGAAQKPEARHHSFQEFEELVLESVAGEEAHEDLLFRLRSDARAAGKQSARIAVHGIAEQLISAFESRLQSALEAEVANEISSDLLQLLHETVLVELASQLERALLDQCRNHRVK